MSFFNKQSGRTIKIVDTTLRDGEQTAGVVFANREKIMIAEMLSDLGVDQLEVGVPTMGGDELKAIKDICKRNLKSSIMAWNRAVISDVEKSVECGADAVAVSISVSDIHIQNKLRKSRGWVLESMANSVEFAKKNGLYVSVNGEDASRADIQFLKEFIEVAKQAGADRFRYCDTVGIMTPSKIYNNIKFLRETTGFEIEMHTHNDFGMATANAFSGVEAGANYVGVTVNGLGERAGNAAFEEIAMGLKHLYDYKTFMDMTKLKGVCEYVAEASRRTIPIWKPILGENMFTHESGIHADGALKDPHNYEAFDPSEVGLERKIVIGKHSGRAAILNKLSEYDLHVEADMASKILEEVRTTSVALKRNLLDKEIIQVYLDIVREDSINNKIIIGG
ncbi:MAG: homocitrate synthase [Clostridioides sp.]|jgi:homocitrate synthase NifV|nr:homocitrate synthase [Clostridioides sp.]